MTIKLTSRVFIVAVGVLWTSLVAGAQDPPPTSQTSAQPTQDAKASARRVHKLWTNDDMGSVRSPADIYSDNKEKTAAEAARVAKQTAASNQSADGKTSAHTGPPALSNPKTLDDADHMIGWESRDIDAQEEFINRLRKETDEAPPDRKESLQRMLQERIRTLEDTRKERQTLLVKKKELETAPH